MRTYLIALGALTLTACSTHRNRTKTTATSVANQHHRVTMHDTATRQLDRIRFTHSQEDRLAEVAITPRGTFRYHPDSGYSGEAERVSIRLVATSYHAEADGLAASETSARAAQAEQHSSAHIAQEATRQQLERHPLTAPRHWWVWLAAAVMLLAVVWVYRWMRAKL